MFLDPVPSNLISIRPAEQSVEDNGFDKSESCNSNEEQNGEQNLDDCNHNKTDGYNQLLDENKSIPEKYLDSSNSALVDSKKSYSSSENIDENSVEIDICRSPSESGDSRAEIENSCSSSENIHENSMETDICLCLSESVESQVKNEKLSAALITLEEQNLELNLFEDKIMSVNNENKPGLECNDTVMESTCETNKKIVEGTGGETFSNEIISPIPDITCQELKPSEPTTERQLETDLKPSLTTSESVVNDELSELASEGDLKLKKNKKNSKAKIDNSNVPDINLEENMSSVTDFINNYEKDGSNVQSPKGNFNLGDFMSTNALPFNTYIPNLRSNLNQYYYNTYKEFKQDTISNILVNHLNDSLSLNDDKKIQQEIKGANVHSASYGTSEDIWFDSKYLVESCETAVTQLKSVYSDVNSDHGSILTASDNSKQQTPENNCEQAIVHEKSKSDSNYANTNSISNNKVENKSRFSMSKIPIPKGSTKLANNSGSKNSRKSTSKQILEINNIKNEYEEIDKNLKSFLKLNTFKNGDEKCVATNINLISENEVENKQKPINKISAEKIKSVATLDTKSSSESESSENEVEGKQKPINKISTEKIKSGATLDTESSSESESSENEVEGKQKPINKISTEKIMSGATLDTESSSESESSENEVEGKQKPINKISIDKIKSVATLDTESSESESSENEVKCKQKPINKIFTEKIKSGATLDNESSSESESSENEVECKQKTINKIFAEKIKFGAILDTESSSESESSENDVECEQKPINKIFAEKIKSGVTLDTESSSESESSDDETQFKLLEHAFQDLMKKRGKHAKARNEKIKSYLHEIERLKLSSKEPSIAKTSMSLRSSSRCGSQKKYEPKDEFPRKVIKPIQKSQTRPSSRLQNQYEAHPQLSQPYYQYGQPQPLYNQSVPQFSQPSLQYTQAQPLYNQSIPQFSQPSLQYAQAQPLYNQSVPHFSQPSLQYAQPSPQFIQPGPRFIQPTSQHTQLGPQYVQPGSMPPSMQNPHISSRCHRSSRFCSRQS
ncbi:hypothetical protein TNCV_4184271 [Trichonephila clavipes]|nr:hypothetical protein TNCV_4184271 [Trichonephila clavipes]